MNEDVNRLEEETNPVLPKILFIEFTSLCNMHCSFCPSDVLERHRCHIDDLHLRRFLQQIHDMGIHPPILCNVLGEPLLNKKIYGYLDLFEEKGHEVTLITNTILLRDVNTRKELLKHNNLTIALSIQTVTKESFKMRGASAISLKEMLKIPYTLIEEKFSMGSGARIEVHIATNHDLMNDPTVIRDGDTNLWGNFSKEQKESKWLWHYIKKLNSFAKKIKKQYPAEFEKERSEVFQRYHHEIGTKISISSELLPENYRYLTEEVFWGYMFLPHVFLRFKGLALWNRDYTFIRRAVGNDKFIYIEENTKAQPCFMTENIGILSNGEIVVCCLDYEGEMKLGNIASTNLGELLHSDRIKQLRSNAMSEKMCRRCKGHVFILDTEPIKRNLQPVTHTGRGWYGFETDLHGIGGRWTDGFAWSYIYCRIHATKIRIRFLHDLGEDINLPDISQQTEPSIFPFSLEIHAFNEELKTFRRECVFSFGGVRGSIQETEFSFNFKISSFYKIVLKSPTFCPDKREGNGDTRRLGLAVFKVELIGIPG